MTVAVPRRSLTNRLALALLCLGAAPATAQRFYEVGAGWSAVAPAPASSTDRFRPGPFFRGSIGGVLAPRVRVRFDADAMLFRFQTPSNRPCPFPACPRQFYDDRVRGVGGVAANGLLGLDRREIAYLIAGVGAYDANAAGNSLHVGASVGAGVSVPVGKRSRAFVEATWHGLAPDPANNGPQWLTPVAVGVRF
jgi:hypothetical protein